MLGPNGVVMDDTEPARAGEHVARKTPVEFREVR
jgi:hypothetical protein